MSELNALMTTAGGSELGRTKTQASLTAVASCITVKYRRLHYKLLTEESEKIFSGSWFAALRLLPDSSPL